MSDPDPHGTPTLSVALITASRKMRTLFDRRVRQRGLTLARARALLTLSRSGGCTQRALCDALDIEHPTAVRLLDGLEKQGLIARCAVEGDRRAKFVRLTEAATGQVREIEALTEGVRHDLAAGIAPEALQQAIAVLDQVTRNAEAALEREREDRG